MPEEPENRETDPQAPATPAQAKRERRSEAILEILEACLLAAVAVATAWSGYQSARWDGSSAESYALASKYRVESDEAATLGGQQRLYDVTTFNSWLQARSSGDRKSAVLLEQRFTDNYKVAFDAWLKTDPFNNPKAPPGPIFMPQYVNPLEARAGELGVKAADALDAGAHARETGDDYVRVTVFLATVLFTVAVSQRFRNSRVRVALIAVAAVFLAGAAVLLVSYRRI
jgi:hypothetical protein